jgi:hypothetical protein
MHQERTVQANGFDCNARIAAYARIVTKAILLGDEAASKFLRPPNFWSPLALMI